MSGRTMGPAPTIWERSVTLSSRFEITSEKPTIPPLPAVMRERAVRFRHAVRVFTLLHVIAAGVGGFHQLSRQTGVHRVLRTAASGGDQPANCERLSTLG